MQYLLSSKLGMMAVPHCLKFTQMPLLTPEGMSREARSHSEVPVQQLEDYPKTLAELIPVLCPWYRTSQEIFPQNRRNVISRCVGLIVFKMFDWVEQQPGDCQCE